ncbi:hypothetical protein Q8A67_014452 [Cirrhinus molitorella]|uniref:Uncharacterized protein n=1 Tax=Cirrhinus molitorella TaxID=172907 RepID=A0AA88TMP1_9TELE|nr:hypothetical protein Q8A67_014452 [Cirrhinus molitorella]
MYRICLFHDGQTSVVPISWIFDDKGTLKCRWTSSLSNIKNNSPPNPNWKVYDIVKIIGPSTGDYDQANKYISDYTTGVSAAEDSVTYSVTDPAVVELPKKRKKKKKLCDESDLNSETSSCEDDINMKKSGTELKQSGLKTRNVPLPRPPVYHDTLQRTVKKDVDDPKSAASSEFHDLQQHHMTSKELPEVQKRIPDDVHLKKSRNPMKRVGLKTKIVQLANLPISHVKGAPIQKFQCDCLDEMTESPDKSYFNSGQPYPASLDFCVICMICLTGNVAKHDDDHPKSSASSEKEPKEPKSKVTMEKLFDLNTKILQHIQMLEERQTTIMNDLAKIKAVLIKKADEDTCKELFKQQKCSSFETFEAFCQKLEEDKNYRELYVNSHPYPWQLQYRERWEEGVATCASDMFEKMCQVFSNAQ